jgi:hypothetical protein
MHLEVMDSVQPQSIHPSNDAELPTRKHRRVGHLANSPLVNGTDANGGYVRMQVEVASAIILPWTTGG